MRGNGGGRAAATRNHLLPCLRQGIRQEPKLSAHDRSGPRLPRPGGLRCWRGRGGGCLHKGPIGFSLLGGFQPKLEAFHGGLYKNCVSSGEGNTNLTRLLGKNSSICPSVSDQMVGKDNRAYLHLIPCVTTRGRQVQHKSTTDLLRWPLRPVCMGHNRRHVKMYVAADFTASRMWQM